MEKQIVNKVRQVLFNELGLTRDSVREITEKIVSDTVVKHMKHLEETGRLDRIVGDAIVREFKARSYGLHEAVRDAVATIMREHIKFEV